MKGECQMRELVAHQLGGAKSFRDLDVVLRDPLCERRPHPVSARDGYESSRYLLKSLKRDPHAALNGSIPTIPTDRVAGYV